MRSDLKLIGRRRAPLVRRARGTCCPSSVEGGPRASEVTVDGGYLLRLVISLPGPDGQMRNPMMVNFIDVYLQMLNEVVSRAGWRQAELPSQRRAV